MNDEYSVPHFNVHKAKWQPLPQYGGHQAILYTSPNGKRVAGTFLETGKFTFEYTFDEFLYVVRGSARASVRGGEVFDLVEGDIAYFRQGLVVDFEMSDDFQDVTCLVSDEPIAF